MIWGYSLGIKKVHCFVPMENPDLYVSLCNKVVSFIVDPVEEEYDEHINICFNCLLVFIQKGEVKP